MVKLNLLSVVGASHCRVDMHEAARAALSSPGDSDESITIAPIPCHTSTSPNNRDYEERKNSRAESSLKSFIRVFRYNDTRGWILNAIAFLAMIGAGTALPLMDVVFGGFVNVFNNFVTGKLSPAEYMDEVGHYTYALLFEWPRVVHTWLTKRGERLYFVYIFIGRFSLIYTWTMLVNITAIRTTKNLRVDFVRQILRQEISFFDTPLLSVSGQVTINGNLIYYGISEKLGLVIQALSMLISAFIVAFVVQWKLTLITLAIVPVNTIVMLVCIYFDAKYEYQMFDIYGKSGSLAEEAFSTIRTAHAFWAFPKLAARFREILKEARQVGDKKSVIYAILFPVEFFSITAGYALAFWQGMRMYSSGEIQSPGTVVTVIFAVLVAAQALTQIAPQMIAISKAMAAAQDLFSTIDRKSSIDSLSDEGIKIQNFQGNVEIRALCFSYPSRPSVPVLDNLGLDFPSGRTTAIVGASGSGKSTIFGLLERWYPYSSGEITLDGQRLEDINLRWLRTNIRLIQQEPTLFSGTIYQNVVDGLCGTDHDSLPDEDKRNLVIEACKSAFIHDFIQDLPSGYETWIGERGASLSGGQKQRIVIARTIISDPKVLLLDEATSALDPSSEKIVQAALNTKGKMIERGTHAELIELGGVYARLVRAQDLGQSSDQIEEAPDDGQHKAMAGKELTQISTTTNHNKSSTEPTDRHALLHGLFLVLKEQRALWWPALVIFLSCMAGGITYPAMAVLVSKSLEAYETTDVTKANFFALMFFVVALGNLVLYAATGWLSNVVAQSISSLAAFSPLRSGYLRIRLESKFEQDTVERFATSSAIAAEAVMAIRTVSSLALEWTIIQRYQKGLEGIARHSIGSLGYKMLFYSLSQSVSMLAMGLGFWYGGKLVSTGEYTSSQFYIVYLAVIFSGEAAAILFQHTTSISKAGTAINYIFKLRRDRIMFDDEPGPDFPPHAAIETLRDEKGLEVAFDDVHFSYPLRPKQKVLRGVNIKIKSGTMVAFVGASGCGKSTLVGLLQRFYDPTTGILWAGHRDIKTLHRRTYRRDMALVQQEPVLYQGSIRENITLGIEQGDRDPTETQIMEVCQSANIWDFVLSLPDGLETPCGNQGFALSGGQRQRIAIARALIRKPQLLLLDEATSALDTESERVVKAALDRAAAGRTTIAVAHRLSTIKDADNIIVVSRGSIVESGTHDELLRKKGVYHEMVLGQSLDREVG
ncbi:ATP-binding cassette sub-family B member 5 [Metarhizium acridum CQMa 102]|uniref:ATP-binding cassette sub-family B member 5 n=1 Tax=Metarhizium acridum (strain CQMa 102) TaxID=655827 RepID=E9E7Q1_METAQ|nr:ATP-binding cassette sub-family B member 5 [Metarhizium acridum CQMa 102]EFY88035.1 ATP-binding cassette sub-family B member 5 [Metarhizium acridum CQMa 102]